MTSFARIRPSLRRAAFVAALGALSVPATAGAAVQADASAKRKRAKPPVVTRVAPMQVQIGQTLEVRGRYFLRGRNKNTVVFKRSGGKAVFVKAAMGTTKLLRVKLPARLQKEFVMRGTSQVATRFRLRVLAKKFGKRFTTASRSPLVSSAPVDGPRAGSPGSPAAPGSPSTVTGFVPFTPEGDCDGDGTPNGVDSDDDSDLLSDGLEDSIGLASCNPDSDGDKVEDGYEYRSARDLNDEEYQDPSAYVPYPGKRPYPNPRDGSDANTDFDGDSLTLGEEQLLWKYAYSGSATGGPAKPGKVRSLESLYYSDGEQYSIYTRGADGRRRPALSVGGYDKQAEFEGWLNASNYEHLVLDDGVRRPLHDVNRDGAVSTSPQIGYLYSERFYLDVDNDTWLSDDERDEDADGLSNYDESHSRMLAGYWRGKYPRERAYRFEYAGTDLVDTDSDGDGVRDAADDQDHDDIPNLMELSRKQATGRPFDAANTAVGAGNPTPEHGRVNPFNPCLPDIDSRTCPPHLPLGGSAWAPFDGPPFDAEGDDPNYLVRN